MNEGEIVQEGNAEEIYLEPKSMFVSNFIGETNAISTNLFDSSSVDQNNSTIIIRPEAIKISIKETNTDVELEGIVREVVFLGSQVKYKVSVQDNILNVSKTSDNYDRQIKKESTVKVGWDLKNQISIN